MGIKEQIKQIPGVEAILSLEETMNSILFGKIHPSLDNIACVIFDEKKVVKQEEITTDEKEVLKTKCTAIECETKEQFDFLWSYMTNTDSPSGENFKDPGTEGILNAIGLTGAIVLKSNIEFFKKDGNYTLFSFWDYINMVDKADNYYSYLLNLAQAKGYKDGKFISNQKYHYPVMVDGEISPQDLGLSDESQRVIYSADGVWSKLETSLPYE